MKRLRSCYRGHNIYRENGKWFYSDTGEATIGNIRPCGFCGRKNTFEGHDGCIGTLKNVINACCGHGVIEQAYIQFRNGNELRGSNAIKYLKKEAMKNKFVFINECAVDGCKEKNMGYPPYQMCKRHQEAYDRGEKLIAFYGKIVQKQPKKRAGSERLKTEAANSRPNERSLTRD